MKLPTPPPPSRKSEISPFRKGGWLYKLYTYYTPIRTGSTDGHSFMFLVMINNAIFYREPSATTKTLASVIVKVGERCGDIVPR